MARTSEVMATIEIAGSRFGGIGPAAVFFYYFVFCGVKLPSFFFTIFFLFQFVGVGGVAKKKKKKLGAPEICADLGGNVGLITGDVRLPGTNKNVSPSPSPSPFSIFAKTTMKLNKKINLCRFFSQRVCVCVEVDYTKLDLRKQKVSITIDGEVKVWIYLFF